MNTEETIPIIININNELRDILNNQDSIKNEMIFNVEEKKYKDYLVYIKTVKNNNAKYCITENILKLLFEQYPDLDKIKDSLIISTFRTSLTTTTGLNGETNLHLDNMLFPGEKNRNIIITWGLGTEALPLNLSKLRSTIYDTLLVKYFSKNDTNIDNDKLYNYYQTFIHNLFDKPNVTLEKIINNDFIKTFSKNIDKYNTNINNTKIETEAQILNEIIHNKIIENKIKSTTDNIIFKSEGPNKDGNITALIMTGKKVYHRRITTKEINKTPIYRYVLNIYYNSKDLNNNTGGKVKKKRKNNNKSEKKNNNTSKKKKNHKSKKKKF